MKLVFIGTDSVMTGPGSGFRMLEKLKNFALLKAFPASLFFLSFCSNPNSDKPHVIPYEQMPLEVSDEATPEVKFWAASFKKYYNPLLLDQLANELLLADLAPLKLNALQEENKKTVFIQATNTPKTNFNKDFLVGIQAANIGQLKVNLESFIKSKLQKIDEPLKFSTSSTNLLDPLLNKTANADSYTKLLQIIALKTLSRADLRFLNLAVIYTPGHVTLGYVIKDNEQGWLLMGLNTSGLGQQTKYYGPTSQLSGTIAVVDIESALILNSLKSSLKDLTASRNFILDHSAKKLHYSLANLNLTFKENGTSAFDLEGDSFESEIPFDEDDLEAQNAVVTVDEGSVLGSQELEKSYAQYQANLARQAEQAKINEEQQRLGSNFVREGNWPTDFKGREALNTLVDTFIKNKKVAPTFILKTMLRDRDCFDQAVPPENTFLAEWGISGANRAWKFQEFKNDNLGSCLSTRDLGDETTGQFVSAYTRILQPLFLAFPKEPETLGVPTLKGGVSSLYEKQKVLADEIAINVCNKIGWRSFRTAQRPAPQLLEKLGRELFHSTQQSSEAEFQAANPDYNIFSIRCYFVPPKDSPKTLPSEELEVEKESAKSLKKKRIATSNQKVILPSRVR